ncbi:hypothetical protein [Acrocarpospora sp. B8E8]|uniref:hypothetical protein n=1 Tax=Acrocarpospora sp. B8E8 TaxID=3153572 RepID=UPI00325DF5C5
MRLDDGPRVERPSEASRAADRKTHRADPAPRTGDGPDGGPGPAAASPAAGPAGRPARDGSTGAALRVIIQLVVARGELAGRIDRQQAHAITEVLAWWQAHPPSRWMTSPPEPGDCPPPA